MTSAQWGILGMLAMVGIIQGSDAQLWHYVQSGQNIDVGIQDGIRFGHIPGFLFGSFLLVWLATVLPRIATGIAAVILLLVVLSHADKVGTFLQFGSAPQHAAQGSK